MARLSERERQEMLGLASSSSLKEDVEYLASHRHNPVIVNGAVDMDRLIEFFTQFNE